LFKNLGCARYLCEILIIVCHIFRCAAQDNELMHQPTNAPNKIQFMTSIELPHVVAPRCLLQGLLEHRNTRPAL